MEVTLLDSTWLSQQSEFSASLKERQNHSDRWAVRESPHQLAKRRSVELGDKSGWCCSSFVRQTGAGIWALWETPWCFPSPQLACLVGARHF